MEMDKRTRKAVLRVLTAARARIEKGWTVGAQARTANGELVAPRSKEAVRWCATGAVFAVKSSIGVRQRAIAELARSIKHPVSASHPDTQVTYANDRWRSKARVLALFDRTIRRLEEAA